MSQEILFKKRTSEFRIKIGITFKDNKRDLIVIDRQYEKDKNGRMRKKYKYKCNVCGWAEGWIEESALIFSNNGCSCCRGLTVVEGINSIIDTAPWMVKYFQGGYDEAKLYTKTSNKKIYSICPHCGRIKDKEWSIDTIYRRKSIGCSCEDGISYPNKIGYNLLEQLSVKFESEYSPKWCGYQVKNKLKTGRYDFYFEFNNEKYFVEMDGSFHTKDNRMNGQTAKESKQIDDYKDKLAKENNIEVIRINSSKSELEYIKNNILNSKLSKIFDLNIIDWNKCEEFALNNLVKDVCEFKKLNSNLTTLEIGKIFKLSRSSISNYLKKGTKLGWCMYDGKKESLKVYSNLGEKSRKLISKKVEIFKDGLSMGVFPSCTELAKKSKETFGVKLLLSCISAVCLKKQSIHKGFTFKYVC